MRSDSSEPEEKEASLNKKKFIQSATSMLEKLVEMNATKTELRQYNLAIIITKDTIRTSAGRVYFDEVLNHQACARDRQEGPLVIQTDNLGKFHTACLFRLIIKIYKPSNNYRIICM